jgi:hypothetical protein
MYKNNYLIRINMIKNNVIICPLVFNQMKENSDRIKNLVHTATIVFFLVF